MNLTLFNATKHEDFLKQYSLKDITYTDTPQNVIDKTKNDKDRYSIVILDDKECKMVGFFCLHLDSGPKEYGYYQNDYALVRSFSIDNRYRNQGYASKALESIFEFIDSTLNLEINHIILAVNEKNIGAQKAYKNSGFKTINTDIEGKKGKLLIMEKVRE